MSLYSQGDAVSSVYKNQTEKVKANTALRAQLLLTAPSLMSESSC